MVFNDFLLALLYCSIENLYHKKKRDVFHKFSGQVCISNNICLTVFPLLICMYFKQYLFVFNRAQHLTTELHTICVSFYSFFKIIYNQKYNLMKCRIRWGDLNTISGNLICLLNIEGHYKLVLTRVLNSY